MTEKARYGEVYTSSINRATERMFGQAVMQQIETQAQLDAAAAQIADLQRELGETREKVAAQGKLFEELAQKYPDDPELRHLVGFPDKGSDEPGEDPPSA